MLPATAFVDSPNGWSEVTYCRESSLTQAQRDRVEDAAWTWTTRNPDLSITAGTCGGVATTHIKVVYLDGPGQTVARVGFNPITLRAEVMELDSSETFWNGYPHPSCGSTTYQDFWGVVAHEFGHTIGLAHTGFSNSPQGDQNTMRATNPGYGCPAPTDDWRSLSQDDEQGSLNITSGQFASNRSFERSSTSQDCIDPGYCVNTWHWNSNIGFTRDCTTAYIGTCSMRSNAATGGTIKHYVHRMPCNGSIGACQMHALLAVHIPSETLGGAYTFQLRDLDTNPSVLDTETCDVDPGLQQSRADGGDALRAQSGNGGVLELRAIWDICSVILQIPLGFTNERRLEVTISSAVPGSTSYMDALVLFDSGG